MGEMLEPGTKNLQLGNIAVDDASPARCMKVKISRCQQAYVIM